MPWLLALLALAPELRAAAGGCRFAAELSGATAPEPRTLQRQSCEDRGGRYMDVAVTPRPGPMGAEGSWEKGLKHLKPSSFRVFL